MRYLLTALTLLTASAALAQTTPIALSISNSASTSVTVGPSACGDEQSITWTYNGQGTLCSDLRIWVVSGTSCGDEPSGTYKDVATVNKTTVPTQRTATVSFNIKDLPGFGGTSGVECGAADREDEYRICATFKQGTGAIDVCSSTTVQKDDFPVTYDSKPPDPPTIESVAEMDKALSVRVGIPDDTNEIVLVVKRADGTGTRTLRQSSGQPLFRIENLENGVMYDITATALDAADNESAVSEVAHGTPIFTRGFFDRYVEANGQEMGGCGAAGSVMGGWVLAVLGFWLSSRRNRS